MDRYSDMMLDRLGVAVMIGKAERGADTVARIAAAGACYLIAVGGAAVLVSQAIRGARPVAFEDLGMEAVRRIRVRDFPAFIVTDDKGNDFFARS